MFLKHRIQTVRTVGSPTLRVRSQVKAGKLAVNRCEKLATA
jgi:hypothetical protein